MDVSAERLGRRKRVLDLMDRSFVMVPARLIKDVAEARMTTSAFFLYVVLLFRQGVKDRYWGSIADMCWNTGLSEAQVSRLLKQLERCGHIRRVRRNGTTSVTYCLTTKDSQKIAVNPQLSCSGATRNVRTEPVVVNVDNDSESASENGCHIPEKNSRNLTSPNVAEQLTTNEEEKPLIDEVDAFFNA